MVRVAIALVGLLVVNVASARLVEEYDWVEVRTDNFVIYSLLSERQTLMTARHLELFRNAIPAGILPWNQDMPVPDRVFLLKGTWQINDLGYERDTWYYTDNENGEFILIGANTYAFTGVDVAYLRFLIGADSRVRSVLWYEEGLIRLFSDSRIDDGYFVFGRVGMAGGWQKAIDWLFDDMDHTRLSQDRYASLFTMSAAIVRMLVEDTHGQQTFGARLSAYAGMVDRGRDPRQAFEAAFRIPVEELGDRLDEFKQDRCCRMHKYPLETLLPEFNYEMQPLRRAEVALALGSVAASLGARDEARRLYNRARRNDDTRAAAEAGLEALEQKNTTKKCPECNKNKLDSVDSHAKRQP